MRTSLRILLPTVVLSACSTTPESTTSTRLEDEFLQPNAIVRQEIDKRIREIPFQHQDNLLANLLWLSERGEIAIPQLLGALESDEPKTRSSAAWALGQIRERRVVPRLRPLLEDEHESVRLEAARVLMLLGDFSAAPTLIVGLDSDSAAARYKCSEGLKLTTGRDFDFDHLSEDASARAESVLAWREWWAKQSNDPFFHDSYATAHGLPTLDEQAETPIDPSEVPAQPSGDLMMPMGATETGDEGAGQGSSTDTRPTQGLGSAGAEPETGTEVVNETEGTVGPQGQPEGMQPEGAPSQGGEQPATSGSTQGTAAPGAQPSGTGASSTDPSGTETPGAETPGTGTSGTETPGVETPANGETPAGTETEEPASPFDWLKRRVSGGN